MTDSRDFKNTQIDRATTRDQRSDQALRRVLLFCLIKQRSNNMMLLVTRLLNTVFDENAIVQHLLSVVAFLAVF
jgi:hypothetical protein